MYPNANPTLYLSPLSVYSFGSSTLQVRPGSATTLPLTAQITHSCTLLHSPPFFVPLSVSSHFSRPLLTPVDGISRSTISRPSFPMPGSFQWSRSNGAFFSIPFLPFHTHAGHGYFFQPCDWPKVSSRKEPPRYLSKCQAKRRPTSNAAKGLVGPTALG